LIAALRKEAKDLATSAGVKARVTVSPEFGRLPAVLETAIYRVVQEALHNVAKHANASTVTIDMRREGDWVKLLIEDDGVGISSKPIPGRQTFGMAGMRERIGNLGGKMKVTSPPGNGTRIEVSAPATYSDSALGLAAGKPVAAACIRQP
jgi:signal transduction histidine kinase